MQNNMDVGAASEIAALENMKMKGKGKSDKITYKQGKWDPCGNIVMQGYMPL